MSRQNTSGSALPGPMFSRNQQIPRLKGPYVRGGAHSISPWIKNLARPPIRAVHAYLPAGKKEDWIQAGLNPWELLPQRSFQIGYMAKSRVEDERQSPNIPFDEMSYAGLESSVVRHWDVFFGQPVNHCLMAVARAGLSSEIAIASHRSTRRSVDSQPISWAVADRLCTQPERTFRMIFDDDDETRHYQEVVDRRNAEAAAKALRSNKTKPKPLRGPDDWVGRPDNTWGYFKPAPPTTPAAAPVPAAADAPVPPADVPVPPAAAPVPTDTASLSPSAQKAAMKALQSLFVPAVVLEDKKLGLLHPEGYNSGLPEQEREQQEPQEAATSAGDGIQPSGPAYNTRSRHDSIIAADAISGSARDPIAAELQLVHGTHGHGKFSEGAIDPMLQAAVYCRILDIDRAFLFDSGALILLIFVDMEKNRKKKKKRHWRGLDSLWLGDNIAVGTMNVHETPADVVLTTILGFVIEGLVEALRKEGEACSVKGIRRLVEEFLGNHPEVWDRIVNEVVDHGADTAAPATAVPADEADDTVMAG